MNRIFIATIFLLSFCFAYEDLNIPGGNGNFVEYSEDNSSLINIDGMKKQDDIKQNETLKQKNRKIKMNTKQINQQRALDYMTKQSNVSLPRF